MRKRNEADHHRLSVEPEHNSSFFMLKKNTECPECVPQAGVHRGCSKSVSRPEILACAGQLGSSMNLAAGLPLIPAYAGLAMRSAQMVH